MQIPSRPVSSVSDRREQLTFISYARRDMRLATSLWSELQPLLQISRRFAFTLWRDSGVLPGEDWHCEIQQALADCDVGLLLLSPTFFTRPYIVTEELPRLLAGDKVIIPVMLCPVNFTLQDGQDTNRLQIFSLPKPDGSSVAFSQCRNRHQREDFISALYESIERRLRKVWGC